jgi:hypothetical protein
MKYWKINLTAKCKDTLILDAGEILNTFENHDGVAIPVNTGFGQRLPKNQHDIDDYRVEHHRVVQRPCAKPASWPDQFPEDGRVEVNFACDTDKLLRPISGTHIRDLLKHEMSGPDFEVSCDGGNYKLSGAGYPQKERVGEYHRKSFGGGVFM